MITDAVQRWRAGRASYRPAGEPIDPRAYEVAPIEESVARDFVLAHHYAASYPAARFRYGMFRGPELVGTVVFSHPVNDAVLRPLPGERKERCELGRLVLLDDVPANGESWLIARCFELVAREGIAGVVSFSDPVPRARVDGRVVFKGHIGTVYQATNATYTGRGTRRTLKVLPDGSILNDRALQKVRGGERGWEYVMRQLVDAGAAPLRGEPDAWLREQLPRVTRPLKHPGNHRYLFGLTRAAKKALPQTLRAAGLEVLHYPKLTMWGDAA